MASVRPGNRDRHRPMRARLRRYRHKLDRLGPHIYALRADPSAASSWMDWYADNEYLVRRILAMLQRDLSASFVGQLPVLASGPSAGTIRAEAIARQTLEDGEQHFDASALEAGVIELQRHAPLTMAELWALPLLLRYNALISLFEAAQELVDRQQPGGAEAANAADDALGRRLIDSIRSLHTLEQTDWSGFVERTSVLNQILAQDPAGAYARMDFQTRNLYRSEVEKLARASGQAEVVIATAAIELTRNASAHPSATAADGHVGCYLIGEGRKALEERLGYTPTAPQRLRRKVHRHAQAVYLSALGSAAALLIALPTAYAAVLGSLWLGIAVACLILIPAAAVSSTLINWLITALLLPAVLPKMDFTAGVAGEHRTLVAISALVSNDEEITHLLHQIERHYLTSRDPNIDFALLTCPFDSPTPTTSRDAALEQQLRDGTTRLNQRYGQAGDSPFFWLHRARTWNSRENVWMGWERKRGKLRELNRLILRGEQGTFTERTGDIERLRQVRYVITLDADTTLPVDAAKKLIATIAHPLNQPLFDPVTSGLRAGYTILQPRTEIDPVTAVRNLFTRIFSGDRGLDLYTLAVSDAYQDLFGLGLFTGKGLYVVDAFEATMDGAAPENALLSHDLFEGAHGRTALVSDVVLYEDYPGNYLAYAKRVHRWVRGDWQLLPWLGWQVPCADGQRRPNRLDPIHRWQIVHNLLRSLQSPVLMVLLLLGWFTLPGSPLHWTALALLTLLVPTITSALGLVPAGLRRRRMGSLLHGLRGDVMRWLLAVTFLPHESKVALDAAARALYRTFVSHRGLLEWRPAAMDNAAAAKLASLARFGRVMWVGPTLAIAIAFLIVETGPHGVASAAPLLFLWTASPLIAFLTSRQRLIATQSISAPERAYLRRVARQTWLFFEQFIGPADHWLPPDHYQESPKDAIAHRTSPTNIGMLLLATTSAYDLGYIDGHELLVRARNTLETLDKLPRLRGHLFNWYETRTLKPLSPIYVSTVDSGNLLGCLTVLERAAADMPDEPVLNWAMWEGFFDTLGELSESLDKLPRTRQVVEFEAVAYRLVSRIRAARDQPSRWAALIDELESTVQTQLDASLRPLIYGSGSLRGRAMSDMRIWLERTHHHIDALKRVRDHFLPWLQPMAAAPPSLEGDQGEAIVDAAWEKLRSLLTGIPTFAELALLPQHATPLLDTLAHRAEGNLPATSPTLELKPWLQRLKDAVAAAGTAAEQVLALSARVRDNAGRIISGTDLAFLYDRTRRVFRIGYNLDRGRLDDNAYDLLASESRLASFLAIAKGDVPGDHWIHLGRPFTRDGPDTLLLSWSGTMFEYLMPELVMAEPETGVLGHSALAAINSQIRFGKQLDIPWGISESGYYALDDASNYGYQAFGVPALAIRSGKSVERVVAPYACCLAVQWRPKAVIDNLRQLEPMGARGRYGFYEAIDFTPQRMEIGDTRAIVRTYMAHHHGMALVAFSNALLQRNARSRFHDDARVQACSLYLQERIPRDVDLEFPGAAAPGPRAPSAAIPAIESWQVPVVTPTPTVHLLSNGRYSALATNTGAGGATWNDVALTRWRPDPTRDSWGTWLYLRDAHSGEVWSVCRQPCDSSPLPGHVRFHAHAVEYQRRDHELVQTLDVTVSPSDDVEIRRLTLTNQGEFKRTITLTTYSEIVLSDAASDTRHPAFSKLFVRSEVVPAASLLVFTRRRRAPEEAPVWMGECLVTPEGGSGFEAFETDRRAFLGRGGSAARPEALARGHALQNTTGDTLDPISAMRKTVTLAPGETARIAFVRLVDPSREGLLKSAERFAFWARIEHTFHDAYDSVTRDLHNIGVTRQTLMQVVRLSSAVLYPNRRLRASATVLSANRLGQPGLWGMGISGDYPIVLMYVGEDADFDEVRPILKAYQYWRKRGLAVDVVFVEVSNAVYQANTRDALWRLFSEQGLERWVGTRGGLFVLSRATLNEQAQILLQSVARVALPCRSGVVQALLARLDVADTPLPRLPVSEVDLPAPPPPHDGEAPGELLYDNGYGGFSRDGREYVINWKPDNPTPAPWSNVIANPQFGFTVSESGGGYTWRLNSGENRLTPWRNDPVLDEPGEAIYVRDEETGTLWCPTPAPIGQDAEYRISHGAGYTRFEHRSHGIWHELLMFSPVDEPVKIARLKLRNESGRTRRLTLTYYAEWVLGTDRETASLCVIPSYDEERGALLARNPYTTEFADQVAFLATTGTVHGYTAERREFLGVGGNLEHPAALARIGLSADVAPGGDPCGALQVHVDLHAGENREVVFLLGAAADRDSALSLVERYRSEPAALDRAWDALRDHWDRLLGTVTVHSPDESLNLLCNRWLLYQTVSCRLYGRTALYQSSGAFGFRDQLQDAMALLHASPDFCRRQMLTAAAHQFPEGDVLHWWHPPGARGVRTRISDDLLWLPYAVCEYLSATGDTAVLDESVPYLRGDPLSAGEKERYQDYPVSEIKESLYQHCLKAIFKADVRGAHGLPLIGGGDWNDGFNRIGGQGKGESVWLGWFLLAILRRFAPVSEQRGDAETAATLQSRASQLTQAIRTHGWDGSWYLRAFFDDGTPLGSAGGSECRIDSIAQSWAVLSGGDGTERPAQALRAAWDELVRADDKIMLLLKPPFSTGHVNPGYIAAYPPGVRENGGQYTHAAAWAGLAYAALGDRRRAGELFALLNPVAHAQQKREAQSYRVEPYVMAADVYSGGRLSGQGGWTWYTGSAAWMYRFILEGLLGVHRYGNELEIKPCTPLAWKGYRLSYRYGNSVYHIDVSTGADAGPPQRIELRDDGAEHTISIGKPEA